MGGGRRELTLYAVCGFMECIIRACAGDRLSAIRREAGAARDRGDIVCAAEERGRQLKTSRGGSGAPDRCAWVEEMVCGEHKDV